MRRAGDDVLPGVDLHPGKADPGVHRTVDGLAHGERAVAPVDDLVAALVCVEHAHAAQHADVPALAAALGEESRAVEHDLPAALRLGAGEHAGGEIISQRVGIVQLFGHIRLHDFD